MLTRSRQLKKMQTTKQVLNEQTNHSYYAETSNEQLLQGNSYFSIVYQDPFSQHETTPIYNLPINRDTNQNREKSGNQQVTITPIIDISQSQIKFENQTERIFQNKKPNQTYLTGERLNINQITKFNHTNQMAQITHTQSSKEISMMCKNQMFSSFPSRTNQNNSIPLNKLLQIIQKYLRAQIKVTSARYSKNKYYQIEYLWNLGDFSIWNNSERAMQQNYNFYINNLSESSLYFFQSIGVTLPDMSLSQMNQANEFNFELRQVFENILFEAIESFQRQRKQISRNISNGKEKIIMRKTKYEFPRQGRNKRINQRNKTYLESNFDGALKLAEKIASKRKTQNGTVINIYINPEKNVRDLGWTDEQKKRFDRLIKSQEKGVKKQNNYQVIDLTCFPDE